MNIKAGFFLIFSFLFCVSIVIETRGFAEDLEIYTLEKSISEALEKNWTVKAVEATVEQANYFKNMARSDFLPKVGMTYNYTRLSEVQTIKSFFDLEVGSLDNYQWVGSISQPLFTGFETLACLFPILRFQPFRACIACKPENCPRILTYSHILS